MKLLLSVLILFLISPMAAWPKETSLAHPRLPMTSEWIILTGKNIGKKTPDDYTIARKYSLVPETPDNLIRNTLLFNCSLGGDSVSFITFVIPKEIDISNFLGRKNISSTIFRIDTTDIDGVSENFQVDAEVKGNEIFVDFTGKHQKAVLAILSARDITIYLDGDRKPFEFSSDSSFKIPLGDKEVELNLFVRTMIDRSDVFSKVMDVSYFSDHCSDLQK